jgi:hypothetical protein
MTESFELTGAPEPKERDIHERVARALNALLLPPALWFCYPAGLVELSAAQAARFVRAGLKAGLPDIFVLYKGVWLIELKRPGGQLSRTRIVKSKHGLREIVGQVERFEELCKTGAVRDIAVCYSVDEVLDRLDAWHIPSRRRVAAVPLPPSWVTP